MTRKGYDLTEDQIAKDVARLGALWFIDLLTSFKEARAAGKAHLVSKDLRRSNTQTLIVLLFIAGLSIDQCYAFLPCPDLGEIKTRGRGTGRHEPHVLHPLQTGLVEHGPVLWWQRQVRLRFSSDQSPSSHQDQITMQLIHA